MNLKKIWTGIAIVAISFSGFVGVGTANAAPPEPTETNAINDYELKKFLNTQYFGNPADTNITSEQLETLTSIDIEGYENDFTEEEEKNKNDGSEGYMDISGLRYAVNLESLNISGIKIDPYENTEASKAVYEELNYLTNLESLNLEHTYLDEPAEYGFSDDFTLNLPNLTYLNLRNNYISDSLYFIAELNGLEELYLGGNYGYTWDRDADGTEQALSQLDNVKRLDLSYNSLSSASYEKYLVDGVMDMDSLEWFNYEGNSTSDLRPWKPVADKVEQSSFANQQLSSSSRRDNDYDGSTRYDLNFYEGTYDYNRAYDVDGVEYILRDQGGLLYDYTDEDLFTGIRSEIPTGEFTGDRTNSGSGQSYNIDELKELNENKELYYGYGDNDTRGSFAFEHKHDVENIVGVLPQEQYIDVEVGESVQTEELTVINSDATATYSTVDELPEGLTLNSETGVISGITEEEFNGMIEIIPEFNGFVDYYGQIYVNFNIFVEEIIEPVITADLPNGKVGIDYEGSITTDVGEITTVDGLPDGLNVDLTTGIVSGVPTNDGEFEIVITAVNGNETVSENTTIIINEADIVEPVVQTNLPNGQVGVNYEGSIIVDNLNGQEYTVSNLPDGLSYDYNTGVVAGIPTNPAVYQVEVAVNGNQYIYEVIIAPADTVDPVLPTIIADLPDGQVGQDYIGSVIVENGEITNTTGLPEGLTINFETGDISGIPTTDGEFDIVITAENSDGETIINQTILINPVDEESVVEAPVVQTYLPDGKINENYEGNIIVEQGEITDVVGLPDGLTFNPDNGVVSGVPTNDGEFKIVITAENDGSETTLTETIVIEGIVEDDDTVVPGEDNQTPPGVNDDTDNVVPGDDTDNIVEDTETEDVETEDIDTPVEPVDEPVKKINSGEISENISSSVSYILFIIIGFGLLAGVGFTKLRNKNN